MSKRLTTSRQEINKLAKTRFRSGKEIAKVRAAVRRREDIDKVAERAGYTSYLMNLHLSRHLDLTSLKLGSGAYVPVMISTRSGGRKSMLDLQVGESVVIGALISDRGVLLRHMLRKKGETKELASGDIIRETWQTLDGRKVATVNINVTKVRLEDGQIIGQGSVSAGKIIIHYQCSCWSCCTEVTIIETK